jgi:hypothetical protein
MEWLEMGLHLVTIAIAVIHLIVVLRDSRK